MPRFSKEFFSGLKYNFDNGPLVTSYEQVEQEGLNCQLLLHMFLEEVGLALPKWLRSQELYLDTDFTEFVSKEVRNLTLETNLQLPELRVGDIFFFSGKQETPPMFYHLVVVSGFFSDGSPILLHAVSRKDPSKDAVTEWNLKKFQKSNRYMWLHGVKRVKS